MNFSRLRPFLPALLFCGTLHAGTFAAPQEISNGIFHLKPQRPVEELRAEFIDSLTEQAATDDPPFSLDYWRLNLRGRRG